ncbi:MAG: cadmium resistance transporter [Methylocella sp.]
MGDELSSPASSHVLIEALSVAGVAAVSYGSTNFDNLVVLSAYGAKPGYRPLFVKLTFIFVCLTVLFVSLALAQAVDTLPTGKIHYLGLIPMGLGGYQILQLILGRAGGEDPSLAEPPGPTGFFAYLGFALVLLANSSDSIGIMTPLLADLKPVFVLACFAAAVTVAIVMSSLANSVARHPAMRSSLEKIAKWALPFLLIGIGVLIFMDQPSDIFVE